MADADPFCCVASNVTVVTPFTVSTLPCAIADWRSVSGPALPVTSASFCFRSRLAVLEPSLRGERACPDACEKDRLGLEGR